MFRDDVGKMPHKKPFGMTGFWGRLTKTDNMLQNFYNDGVGLNDASKGMFNEPKKMRQTQLLGG